ncbi:hypothetical protein FH969_08725 [Miniimonas arenae]|uniref:DUF1499 domain-containing protein n=1 Tax=Miniimonas arenae TaxID=676201 RepID=A0A5C5BBR4_9MICO|nr:hypothetical protein [Miniimonas arenae]TNU73927.1 hypothetical protein FH969_08725 [Miniimonas arenae]
MPTVHYTIPAAPAAALARLRTAATASDWRVDHAASTHTSLVLKRDAGEKTWGWSATISVQDTDGESTSFVATTDDVQNESDFRHTRHALAELFKAAGARRG